MTVHIQFYQLDILGDRIIANGVHVATLTTPGAGDIGIRLQFEDYLRDTPEEIGELTDTNERLEEEKASLEDDFAPYAGQITEAVEDLCLDLRDLSRKSLLKRALKHQKRIKKILEGSE